MKHIMQCLLGAFGNVMIGFAIQMDLPHVIVAIIGILLVIFFGPLVRHD